MPLLKTLRKTIKIGFKLNMIAFTKQQSAQNNRL